jgi:uncharacterized membrane protein YsdA (DUF1294 family)
VYAWAPGGRLRNLHNRLEIGACSAGARIQARPLRHRSFIAGATGYFLVVVSQTLFLRGKRQKAPFRTIQMEVMATYVIAQILILAAIAVDGGAQSKGKGD